MAPLIFVECIFLSTVYHLSLLDLMQQRTEKVGLIIIFDCKMNIARHCEDKTNPLSISNLLLHVSSKCNKYLILLFIHGQLCNKLKVRLYRVPTSW